MTPGPPATPDPGISRREFARRVNRAVSVVQKYVADGRLPVDASGKIPLAAGLLAWAALHPTDSPTANGSPGEQQRTGTDVAPVDEGRIRVPGIAGIVGDAAAAELARKQWDAKLKELTYRQRIADLIPRAEVIADAQSTCLLIQEALSAIPPRVASILEAICARDGAPRAPLIQAVIEDEINRLRLQLYAGRFAMAAAPAPPELRSGSAPA